MPGPVGPKADLTDPALGVIYEEIEGPLAGREKEVMTAIGKVLFV